MSELFTAKFRYQLTELVGKCPTPLEIEARLRDLTVDQVEKLKEYLEANHEEKKTSFSVDYYVGKKRITQMDDKLFVITKKSLNVPYNDSEDSRDVKISVAEESEAKPVATLPKKYEQKRIKDRVSYIQDNYQIDITHVNDEKWEVEVEVINCQKFNVDAFENKINSIYELFTDDLTVIKQFISDKLIWKRNKGNFYTDINRELSFARTLLPADMTKDGLLDHYAISAKADGVQKLMVFYNFKIWLFWPINANDEKSFTSIGIYDNRNWHNTIITGEWVNKNNHYYPDLDNIYLPFDCLCIRGKDIRRNNYSKRFERLATFYNHTFDNNKILAKDIFTYKEDVVDFYQQINQAFRYLQRIKYKNDGLIFTPINSSYLTDGQTKSKNKNRILSQYKDVCKFKAPEDLTIDFLVKEDGLYTSRDKFTGNYKFPFDSNNYVYENTMIGKIVEFAPTVGDTIVYKPIRIREDKTTANSYKVAMDNWSLIHNPLTENTLRGRDNKLMFNYHNQIKRTLISNLSGYVLDIGSGMGGDMGKYSANNNLKEILAVEPNKAFMKEFNNRLVKFKIKDKISTLLAGGEDTEAILQKAKTFFPKNMGKHNFNICFNISLSFFWKDDNMLEKLTRTIHTMEDFYYQNGGQGKVIISYLTIEGSRLKALFDRRGNNIMLNDISLRRMDNNEIYVDIKGGRTVHDQIEYLVYLDKLWRMSGFEPIFQHTADNNSRKDYMLNENSLTYSKLFVYGYAERKNREKLVRKIKYEANCLPVSDKTATNTPYGYRLKGDDERMEIKDNYYRLATMNNPHKLYHAILKLIDKDYMKADVYKRFKMAKELQAKLRNSLDLEYISKEIGFGIKLFNNDNIIGNSEKYIILHPCQDTYEPVIYYDGMDHSIFAS